MTALMSRPINIRKLNSAMINIAADKNKVIVAITDVYTQKSGQFFLSLFLKSAGTLFYGAEGTGRIDQILRDYFEQNKSVNEVIAKDLMLLFIEKGIFNKDHRDGLPIRDLLRELDAERTLSFLKHIKVDRKATNRNWYFAR
jgi:hypothetical protein